MENEAHRTETQAHTAETTRAAGCESGGSVKLRPLTCERKRTMENGPEGPKKQAHKADPPTAAMSDRSMQSLGVEAAELLIERYGTR